MGLLYDRITELDILKSVVAILKDGGFNVVADEIVEGFKRPAVFVGVYPAEIERLMGDIERVTDTVSIEFYPKTETRVQCSLAAEKIKKLFLYKPINVENRVFTLESVSFDVEQSGSGGVRAYLMTCEFDITYEQFMDIDEDEVENIEEINIDLSKN